MGSRPSRKYGYNNEFTIYGKIHKWSNDEFGQNFFARHRLDYLRVQVFSTMESINSLMLSNSE